MDCEVAVVGGGIGGLTVAALLAQRGVDVCLLERESQVGGCAANFEKFGYSFEPGDGLYTGWSPGAIHAQIFEQLPVDPPPTRRVKPGYVVRLPDNTEVPITENLEVLESELLRAFPECGEQAISFYRKLASIATTLRPQFDRNPNFLWSSSSRKAVSLAALGTSGLQILKYAGDTTGKHLAGFSARFQRFIDVQLQTLAQGDSSQVSYLYAALALVNQGGMHAIQGGPAVLAERLAESIKLSGGKIRLNSPVLRIHYDSSGEATGVDLLSGETLGVSRAIISNLTIWDTYGKLIGLNRSPASVRQELAALRAWGAYLVFAGMDELVASTLPADRIFMLTGWQDNVEYNPASAQLMLATTPAWDRRAPAGKRAVTIHAFTDVEQWFTYHQDETDLENEDQQMLEGVWGRLHQSMPELGDSIEVIDTATPRSYYDQTRRKLGMVGGVMVTPSLFWDSGSPHLTSVPNVFNVSDTRAPGGIAGVSQSALLLANHLTK